MTQACDDVWRHLRKDPGLRHLLQRQLTDEPDDDTPDHPSPRIPVDEAPRSG